MKYAKNCKCVTCGERLDWKYEAQAGHYIHGNTKPTYFDERNVHPQCVSCNMYRSGCLDKYALYLESKYGIGILQELAAKSRSKVGFKRVELEQLADEYKEKIKVLDKKGSPPTNR